LFAFCGDASLPARSFSPFPFPVAVACAVGASALAFDRLSDLRMDFGEASGEAAIDEAAVGGVEAGREESTTGAAVGGSCTIGMAVVLLAVIPAANDTGDRGECGPLPAPLLRAAVRGECGVEITGELVEDEIDAARFNCGGGSALPVVGSLLVRVRVNEPRSGEVVRSPAVDCFPLLSFPPPGAVGWDASASDPGSFMEDLLALLDEEEEVVAAEVADIEVEVVLLWRLERAWAVPGGDAPSAAAPIPPERVELLLCRFALACPVPGGEAFSAALLLLPAERAERALLEFIHDLLELCVGKREAFWEERDSDGASGSSVVPAAVKAVGLAVDPVSAAAIVAATAPAS
jgi:hypothetical protein